MFLKFVMSNMCLLVIILSFENKFVNTIYKINIFLHFFMVKNVIKKQKTVQIN